MGAAEGLRPPAVPTGALGFDSGYAPGAGVGGGKHLGYTNLARPPVRLPMPSVFAMSASERARRGSRSSSGSFEAAAAATAAGIRRPSLGSRASSGKAGSDRELFDDEEDEADALYSARARLEEQEGPESDFFERAAGHALSPASGPRSGARARRAMQRQRELARARAREEEARNSEAAGRSDLVQNAFRGIASTRTGGASVGIASRVQEGYSGANGGHRNSDAGLRGLSASALETDGGGRYGR